MQKVVVLSLLASSMLLSQDLSYNILIGSFNENSSKVEELREKVEKDLYNQKGINRVVGKQSGEYYVVVAETVAMDNVDAKKVLKNIRSAGYKDAYIVVDRKTVGVMQTAKDEKADITPQEQVGAVSSETQITLSEAVKTLLQDSPVLKETQFAYMQVGKDLNIANNAYYPTLDVGATYGYAKTKEDNGVTVTEGNGKRTTVTATLAENIYNGGADRNRIISQNHRMDAASYSVVQVADRLTLQFVDAYLGLLKNKKLLDIAKDNVKIHEEIYSQIKERADTGFGRSSESRQAGSRLTLAQANLVSQENNYNDAITTFEKLYGTKVGPESLVVPNFDLPLPAAEHLVFDKAMRCNPTILLQESNIKMAQSVVNEKNAPFRPKLDLEASASYEKNDVIYDDYKENNYNIMLRASYNLYNKNIDKLEKEKSKLAVTESVHSMESARRDLAESLRFSWQTYVLSSKKIEYLTQHVEYAKDTLDSYRDEFRIGRRDLINLLDAESEYNSALKEMAETENAFLYSKYRLLDNMGMLTDSFEPDFAKRYTQGACSIQEDLR